MLKFDSNNTVQDYTLILSRRNHKHIGQLKNVSEIENNVSLNGANEISFTVNKTIEETEAYWDEITDFKYIYVKELDEYYEIAVTFNDKEDTIKSIVGTSACEKELSQTNIYGLEINTELDIKRDDYVVTKFYNPSDKKGSLLDRVLSFVPHYSITHVDSSLMDIQRTFSADDKPVYDFLTGDIADEIGCLFTFNTVDRTISVYDLKTVCKSCGYRGEFSEVCPECGSTELSFYGDDTTIYINKENLAESVEYSTNIDNIKNCFKLQGGDDNMTAAIVNCNPNGSSYIYYFSDEQKHDMSQELVSSMAEYDKLNDSYKEEYSKLMDEIYECLDKIIYYTSSMMPEQKHDVTDSKKEAAKLTPSNLSPTGLMSVTRSTSTATVDSALKNYAKVYVNSGKFKIETVNSEFVYVGQDTDGNNYGTWYGQFKVTAYSNADPDKIDETTTEPMQIKIYDLYETFLDQKIKKKIANDNDEEGSIYDVLSIKVLKSDGTEDYDATLVKFKEALTYYGLNRLISFNDAIQGCIDIMIEEDQANEQADLYNTMYVPYYNKLNACQVEMDARQKTIDEYEVKLEHAQDRKSEINDILNFKEYLGEDLYNEFCCYKREQTYKNENYISDDLDNASMFENARAFYKKAQEELIKSGEHQHTISANLINLLAIEEFKPIIDKFKLGNFLRIDVDGVVYRLRLIRYKISFNNIQNIDVEFSDVTKVRDGVSDVASILSKSQSMASTYDAMIEQMKKNEESSDIVKGWVRDGLDVTNTKIVSNADGQNFIWGKNGFLARRYDDVTETYEPYQLKIINNGLYITDDNWTTISSAVGKYMLKDPDTNEYKVAYGVMGKTVVGELLMGESLYLRTNDNSLKFDENGLAIKSYDNGFNLNKDGFSIKTKDNSFILDNNGFSIKSKDSNFILSPDGVEIKAGAINLEGVITANDNFKVFADGSIEALNAKFSGSITSSTININDEFMVDELGNVTIKSGSIDIKGGSIKIGENFSVTNDGVMKALHGNFSGDITASTININNNFTVNSEGRLIAKEASIYGDIQAESLYANYGIEIYSDNANPGEVYIDFHNDGGIGVNKRDYTTRLTSLSPGHLAVRGEFSSPAAFYAATLEYQNLVQSSDIRLKTDVNDIEVSKSEAFIMGLKPVTYRYKTINPESLHHGFIYQDVNKIISEDDWSVCSTMTNIDDGEDYGALNMTEIIADLVSVVQEQNKKINALMSKE